MSYPPFIRPSPARFLIREYPNKRGFGLVHDADSSRKTIGAQLELWQMVLVCRLTGGDFEIRYALGDGTD
jgi:hypothetical protein